jgi:hypothetical protein
MLIKKANGKKVDLNVSRQSTILKDNIFNYPNGMAAEDVDTFRNLREAELITLTGFEFTQIKDRQLLMNTTGILSNLKNALTPDLNQFNEGLTTEHECFIRVYATIVKFLNLAN